MKTLKFNADKFNPKKPEIGCYLNMPNDLYHSCAGISNTGLNHVRNNPSDYIWNKKAPIDHSKMSSIDLGSAVHLALLEPERLVPDHENGILIGPTKGRDTIKFRDYCEENSDKLVLTEIEFNQVRYSVLSAKAHPAINELLNLEGHNESSIFAMYNDTLCKIRPDIDLTPSGNPALVDVKVTKSIDDWRSDLTWKNPLFTLNYGHNAAFYLEVASAHYGLQYDVYSFLLIQSTICVGRYPVSVFTITRQELENYGFFDDVRANLAIYKECVTSKNWNHHESFPFFEGTVEASE